MTDTTAALRTLAREATRLPHFEHKYRQVDLDGDFDVTTLPEMTREDVTAAAAQAAVRRPRNGSAYLFTSGGSTAEPKLAWIPTEMHLGRLTEHWQPLGPTDVLANLASPGRLWSAHYCYNRLAELAGADVIGLGYVADEELGQWLDFLTRHGTTAVAGTPSQLLRILRFCEETGHPFAATLRAGIWFGEPCDPQLPELRDRVAPGFGLWGNYGSTETWVIGHNGPSCPTDTFHQLPYQHVELVDGAVLVSTLHPGAVAPVLRYRIGDRAERVECPCGRPGPALRIAGRESSLVKFAGTLVSPQQLVQIAQELPGVKEAQVVLAGAAGMAERMEVRVVGDADLETVRTHLLASQIDLGFALRGDEEEFTVTRVDARSANPRTGKTPDLLWTDA
ncbi:AMP-binding protein [Kitasatospora sp. NPDC002040]|uniref:phenylacetate--CoA ligase family protein n=1 Tax=Kitasatospora sp. NPDC002040 TaxID=3154661 RepID=UPI00332A3121